MIRHLLKLTWNKKEKHSLLIVELFFFYLATSFLALVYVSKENSGEGKKEQFELERLVAVDMRMQSGPALTLLKESLLQMKEINNLSLVSQLPYHYIIPVASVVVRNGKTFSVGRNACDANLQQVLQLQLKEGRWFEEKDRNPDHSPMVISASMAAIVFPEGGAVRNFLMIDNVRHPVVGVFEDTNDPSIGVENKPHLYEFADSGYFSILIKLKVPMNEDIYEQIKHKMMSVGVSWGSVRPLSQDREEFLRRQFIPGMVFLFLSAFLVINIVMGLYSLLYQNINRRRTEIGLRRAAGATAAQIYLQIVLEVVFLATIAILIGVIVAYQFAVFDAFKLQRSYYYSAMAIAAAVIYILVVVCALYPAHLASGIQPSAALHDD